MARMIRLAGVSYVPPGHDHHGKGVNLGPVRDMVHKVMVDEPDFVCFPEICARGTGNFKDATQQAPELEPFVAEVGKIAREVKAALIVPLVERRGGQFYNSVPIVDSTGKLVMVYRKNYPTISELDAGISPGLEVPVAECDGVRVGAAVCFDANFPQVAARLERGRARVVFWPSMYWGGRLLQHWALRYGFYIVVSYNAESAVIDMSGRYLIKQGHNTHLVRSGRMLPWATAQVNADREVFHLDYNQDKLKAIRGKYGPRLEIEVHQPEGFFLLASRADEVSVEQVAKEFKLETLRDYLARSVGRREEFLRTHGRE